MQTSVAWYAWEDCPPLLLHGLSYLGRCVNFISVLMGSVIFVVQSSPVGKHVVVICLFSVIAIVLHFELCANE